MPVEENIQLMQRWFREVWNEGKAQTIYDLIAPDAVAIGRAGRDVMHGPAAFEAFYKGIRSAFPDIHVDVDDAFGAGDKVAVRWVATMTHRGDGLGIPATGKLVRVTGITIARILNGQVIEGWDNWDQLGMLEQVGAYSAPEERAA
jgi:steroid delta-isomerase-like uncharacterized protein